MWGGEFGKTCSKFTREKSSPRTHHFRHCITNPNNAFPRSNHSRLPYICILWILHYVQFFITPQFSSIHLPTSQTKKQCTTRPSATQPDHFIQKFNRVAQSLRLLGWVKFQAIAQHVDFALPLPCATPLQLRKAGHEVPQHKADLNTPVCCNDSCVDTYWYTSDIRIRCMYYIQYTVIHCAYHIYSHRRHCGILFCGGLTLWSRHVSSKI